jgi:AcrR family transcriptional regulator
MQVTPRKMPSQRRSAVTVDLVLEAAARILEDRGMDGFNTNAVAELAGISIGSLYQYFPRKEALTVALIVRSHRDIATCARRVLERTARLDLDATLAILMDSLIEMQSAARGLNRILEAEEERLPRIPELTELELEIQALTEELLARHVDAERCSRAELRSAAADMIAIVRALLDAALFSGEPDPADLRARLVRTVKGYLAPFLPAAAM